MKNATSRNTFVSKLHNSHLLFPRLRTLTCIHDGKIWLFNLKFIYIKGMRHNLWSIPLAENNRRLQCTFSRINNKWAHTETAPNHISICMRRSRDTKNLDTIRSTFLCLLPISNFSDKTDCLPEKITPVSRNGGHK